MTELMNWLPFIAAVIVLFGYRYFNTTRRPNETKYHIKVKFAHGIKTRLTLNATQYEQFQAWLNQPDGIFEIGDDVQSEWLDRAYVASVEMRRK